MFLSQLKKRSISQQDIGWSNITCRRLTAPERCSYVDLVGFLFFAELAFATSRLKLLAGHKPGTIGGSALVSGANWAALPPSWARELSCPRRATSFWSRFSAVAKAYCEYRYLAN